jgi:hypothetical protein
MNIHPYIENMLENYQTEHLHSLLEWLDPEFKNLTELFLLLEIEAKNSQTPKRESMMSTPICPLSTHSFSLEEQATFSILNEFGPNVSGKSYFQWLKSDVAQRLVSSISA